MPFVQIDIMTKASVLFEYEKLNSVSATKSLRLIKAAVLAVIMRLLHHIWRRGFA